MATQVKKKTPEPTSLVASSDTPKVQKTIGVQHAQETSCRLGEIKRWMTIGPFPANAVDEEFITADDIDPNKSYKAGNGEIKWQSWYVKPDSTDIYHFDAQAQGCDFSIYYLVNFLYVTKNMSANLHIETGAYCDFLINGKVEHSCNSSVDKKSHFSADLNRGWNSVLVKCVLASTGNAEQSFRAYITDADGKEIEFLLVKNGFLLPDDTETHMFGKNPGDANQAIEFGDPLTDYQRSNPDMVTYIPREGGLFNDGDNEHFLVIKSPVNEELLAFWTQSFAESHGDNHIMLARSSNGGRDWSEPSFIVGTSLKGNETQASWGFPVCSATGRLYCFYTKSPAGTPSGSSSIMGAMQSDDNGHTWKHGPGILVPTTRDVPSDERSEVTGNFIVWQLPFRDSQGRQLVGYTVWKESRGRCFFMRFDNIDDGPDMSDLAISWLPDHDKPLEMPRYLKQRECSEASVVLLPDERLFSTMRTMTGHIWFSVSDDHGHSWRDPEVLRYRDNGEPIRHPLSCCPIYPLKNGKFILLHNNSNHFAERYYNGKDMPAGMNMFTHRRELYSSIGTFARDAHQPIWFDQPRMILDNDGVIVGPKATNEIGTYPTLTEYDGKRILWYPDRKYYLLGKYLTDGILGL